MKGAIINSLDLRPISLGRQNKTQTNVNEHYFGLNSNPLFKPLQFQY